MSQVDRRFTLLSVDELGDDLDRCQTEDSYAYPRILVFLQELDGNSGLCERLIDERYSDHEVQDISPFWHLQDEGLNVFRLKLVDVGAWRLITAGDRRSRTVAVLGLMRRDQDYENDPQFVARLKESYDKLGFGLWGR
ncbi:hypothetical protein [Sphingomonas sp. LHG3443-2]|uniref:hypothetical protein n=1 Tax=Sphingomonas sp. LHG3443-2 TaxID=2804639 RepID=UPI003CF9A7A1